MRDDRSTTRTLGAAVLCASLLAAGAVATSAPEAAHAETATATAEQDTRSVLSGSGTTVLHLRWDGTTPVLESAAADGTVHDPNRVRFALPPAPDESVASGDRNVLLMPAFDPDLDLSWVGRPGERFPAALAWETPDRPGHLITFDPPPAEIDPDSVRLALKESSGPSWMELFSYRPGGYLFTKRLISSAHPWYHNHLFDGVYDLDTTWAFGAPGRYSATFVVYAEKEDGTPVNSAPATIDWDVQAGASGTGSPAPSSPAPPSGAATPAPDDPTAPNREDATAPTPGTDSGGGPSGIPDGPGGPTAGAPVAPDAGTPKPGAVPESGAAAGPLDEASGGGRPATGSAVPGGPAPAAAPLGGPGLPPGPASGGDTGSSGVGRALTVTPGVSSPAALAAAGAPADAVQVPSGAFSVVDGALPAGSPADQASTAGPPADVPGSPAVPEAAPSWVQQIPAAVQPVAAAVATVDLWAWAFTGLALLATAGFTGLFAARRRDRAEALAEQQTEEG